MPLISCWTKISMARALWSRLPSRSRPLRRRESLPAALGSLNRGSHGRQRGRPSASGPPLLDRALLAVVASSCISTGGDNATHFIRARGGRPVLARRGRRGRAGTPAASGSRGTAEPHGALSELPGHGVSEVRLERGHRTSRDV